LALTISKKASDDCFGNRARADESDFHVGVHAMFVTYLAPGPTGRESAFRFVATRLHEMGTPCSDSHARPAGPAF
jgi:hypothetical protein